jgi:hypothetical protein
MWTVGLTPYHMRLSVVIHGYLSTSIHVILMKDQNSDLNALSRLPWGHLRVCKSSMWDPTCTPIGLPVVALNQHDLLWCLPILEVPAMILVGQDCARLSHPARMNQLDRQDILVGHRVRVADGQRVLVYGLDRAPHVDDLETRL